MDITSDNLVERLISHLSIRADCDVEKERISVDRNHWLKIFPELVWQCIAKHVENSTDVENFVNASPYFRSLLLQRRTSFLFPKVWGILKNKWNDIYGDDRPYEQLFMDDGQVITLRGISSLATSQLSIRLVCKSWCDGVDFVAENSPMRYLLSRDSYPFAKTNAEKEGFARDPPPAIFFYPNKLQNMERFLSHFEPTHGTEPRTRNPFPERRVGIYWDSVDNVFLNKIKQIFGKYGHHVWYCSFYGCTSPADEDDFYIDMTQVLQLLPNLKVLEFHNFEDYGSCEPDPAIEEAIAEYPLVSMPQLTFLNCKNLPRPMLKEILRQAGNLKELQIEGDCIEDMMSVPLAKLERLSLILRNSTEFLLLKDAHFWWPLQTLYLEMRCPFKQMAQVFNLIESQWATTLTNLSLGLRIESKMDVEEALAQECGKLRLNLPRVKRLKLVMGCVCTLDFILPMRQSLEHLSVFVLWNIMDYRLSALSLLAQQNQIIQFLGYFEKKKKNRKTIVESNVWKLFPRLKLLNIWDYQGGWSPSREEIYNRTVYFPDPNTNCGSTRSNWLANMPLYC